MDFFCRPDKTSHEYTEWKLQSRMFCFGGGGGDGGGGDSGDSIDDIAADFDNMSAQLDAGETVTSGMDGGVGRGGNDNDNDNDGIPNSIDRTPGVDRSGFGSNDISSPNFDAFEASKGYASNAISNFNTKTNNMPEPDMSARVNEILTQQGYSATNKGTNVTTTDGRAVSSGSYENAVQNAQRQEAFEQANRIAAQNYINQVKASGQKPFGTISDNLLSLAQGVNPDDFTKPVDPAEVARAQQELGAAIQSGQYAGNFSNQFSDPLGVFGAPSVSGLGVSSAGASLLGSNIDQQQMFDNIQAGYNENAGMFGAQLESDVQGNIGFSSFGQRAGDFVMNNMTPFGAVLDFNTMSGYGPEVPGYNNVVSTVSVSPLGLAANQLGAMAGDNAAQAAAKGIYESTGSVDQAIGGAVAAGVGVGATTENLSSSFGKSLGLDGLTMSYSADRMYGPDNNPVSMTLSEARDVSGEFDNSDNNQDFLRILEQEEDSVDPENSAVTTPTLIENAGPSPQQRQQQALNRTYRSQGAPVDLSGQTQAGQNINPIMSANPTDDVTYLTKGRQRDYGKTTYSVATPVQQYRGRRGGSLRRSSGYGSRIII